MFLNAGRVAEARAIANELGQQFQPRSRAYGETILADIERAGGRRPQSADALGRARKLSDLWLGRFLMGVTFVEAGRYENAQPDFELCLKRQGEATALFLNDVPSFRYLAPLHYWLARAQDGRKQAAAETPTARFSRFVPKARKIRLPRTRASASKPFRRRLRPLAEKRYGVTVTAICRQVTRRREPRRRSDSHRGWPRYLRIEPGGRDERIAGIEYHRAADDVADCGVELVIGTETLSPPRSSWVAA